MPSKIYSLKNHVCINRICQLVNFKSWNTIKLKRKKEKKKHTHKQTNEQTNKQKTEKLLLVEVW